MRRLEGEEEHIAKEHLDYAAALAENAQCLKSKRGVVIIQDGLVAGEGWNSPPEGEDYCRTCFRDEFRGQYTHTEPCRDLHAEQRAILDGLKRTGDLEDSIMYHVKIKNGEIATSGKPSCTICAKLIKEVGISEFVLFHEEGIFVYTAHENYKLSLQSIENVCND